jgi:hypothetical protein
VHKPVADACFGDTTTTTETKHAHFASAAEWVHVQLTATPLASLLADQLERRGTAGKITASVEESLRPYEVDGALELPLEVHVVLARA